MIHIYQGFCPDDLEPDNRDPNCPACQVEAERDDLRAENVRLVAKNEQLVTSLNWIHHAASWLKNNNKNPRAWQCIQDIIDRSTQDGK